METFMKGSGLEATLTDTVILEFMTGVYEHAETGVIYKGNWKNDREEGEGE